MTITNKYFKLILFLAFLGIVLFTSGCEITVDAKIITHINRLGSGVREFVLTIDKSQFNAYYLDIEDIINVIKRNCPPALTIKEIRDSYDYYKLVFDMDFEDVNFQLGLKSLGILGYLPSINYEVEGSPFCQQYIFVDDTPPRDYFNWISFLLKESGLLPDYVTVKYNVKSYISLYGMTKDIPFNGRAISKVRYDLNSYLVTVSISPESYSVALKINIPKDIERKISESMKGQEDMWGKDLREYLMKYFNEVPEEDTDGNYTIIISSSDIKELEDRLRNTVDRNMMLAIDKISNSTLKEDYQLTLTGNFAQWLGDTKIANTKVTINTPKAEFWGNKINTTTFENTSRINTTVDFSTYIVSPIILISLLIGVLLLILGLILLIIRHYRKKSLESGAEKVDSTKIRNKRYIFLVIALIIILGIGAYLWKMSSQNDLESSIQSKLSDWFYAWQKVDPKFSIKDFKKEDTKGLVSALTCGGDKFYYPEDEIIEKMGVYSPDRTKVIDLFKCNGWSLDEKANKIERMGLGDSYIALIDLERNRSFSSCLGMGWGFDRAIWLDNNTVVLAGSSISEDGNSVIPILHLYKIFQKGKDIDCKLEIAYAGPKFDSNVWFYVIRNELERQDLEMLRKKFPGFTITP